MRERCKRRGIELIAPYRKNNKVRRYEDGRKLRRHRRRWIIERINAWQGQFRPLLIRHEYLLTTYRAFFDLTCRWITLRKCL
jgi:transposase